MLIQEDFSLLEHHTLAVPAKSRWWITYDSLADLERLASDEYFASLDFVSLGLGANTLFCGDYSGAVLHSCIDSIERIDGSCDFASLSGEESYSLLRVGSGVLWDQLVSYSLSQGLYGLETLSGIPSSVGAAVVQNIGAYGSEVGQFVYEVEFFDFATKQSRTLAGSGCQFGYRSSCFKQAELSEAVITYVTFKLPRHYVPNLTYQALREQFEEGEIPSAEAVREKVLAIRATKLPPVEELPNAGSFFKNPLVSESQLRELQSRFPSMPFWANETGGSDFWKIPAAWLIEQVGYKGKRSGNVGCYERQPLVVVNYGVSSGREIVDFAEEVQRAVASCFDILLEPEVRYIG